MSSLVILAASIVADRAEKQTDRQTDRQTDKQTPAANAVVVVMRQRHS